MITSLILICILGIFGSLLVYVPYGPDLPVGISTAFSTVIAELIKFNAWFPVALFLELAGVYFVIFLIVVGIRAGLFGFGVMAMLKRIIF